MEKEVYLQMWVLLSGSLQQASSQEQPLYVSLLKESAFKEKSPTRPKQD